MENKLNKKAVLESIEQELVRLKEESSYLEEELKANSGFAATGYFGSGLAISALLFPDYIIDNLGGNAGYIGIAGIGTFLSVLGIWATYNVWKDLREFRHLCRENREQIRKDVDKLRRYDCAE